ncbi:MAG: matrixin family metalloprotease [Bacteroidota bacterium]
MRNILLLLLVVLACACRKNYKNNNAIKNESGKFAICNSRLTACATSSRAAYCLFGYKWGADSSFVEVGMDATGPAASGGVVTFSFQEENGPVNTHRQINLASKSFSNLVGCAKSEIRNALDTWSQAADIDFRELPENSDSDIRFFVADIVQTGVGYPNYSEASCSAIKGTMIINAGTSINDCNDFFLLSLHEIGHVLGLGHVSTRNVMNPDFFDFNLDGLQKGDREGIIQIYGEN